MRFLRFGRLVRPRLDADDCSNAPASPAPATSPERQGTLLLLVRHGETPTTGTVLPGRAPGLHLSDRGRAQAERVAERLAGLSVDALYSSPLERACETAEPTAARTGTGR